MRMLVDEKQEKRFGTSQEESKIFILKSLDLFIEEICDPPREKGPFDAYIFFAFFYTSGCCSETALQNDAICSDVTRSTRALYAQIARVAVERESSYSRPKFTSGQIPRLRICVIPRACA